MSVPPPAWSDTFRVRAYEIDPDLLLTLPTLCNYFQEAAGNHATAYDLASDHLLAGGVVWVLARLQVEVQRRPAWRELITVETWPSAFDRLYAQRDFVVTDAQGEIVARATSQWFVMDVVRRRPLRLPPAVAEITRPDRPHALPPDRATLPDLGAPSSERLFSVRRHDLDLSHHVNNVRYVEWALEAVPDSVRDARSLYRLDVQFRAESVYGDTVRSACSPADSTDGTFLLGHEVTRQRDGHLLARARTVWR